jgi:hypothetical protein
MDQPTERVRDRFRRQLDTIIAVQHLRTDFQSQPNPTLSVLSMEKVQQHLLGGVEALAQFYILGTSYP